MRSIPRAQSGAGTSAAFHHQNWNSRRTPTRNFGLAAIIGSVHGWILQIQKRRRLRPGEGATARVPGMWSVVCVYVCLCARECCRGWTGGGRGPEVAPPAPARRGAGSRESQCGWGSGPASTTQSVSEYPPSASLQLSSLPLLSLPLLSLNKGLFYSQLFSLFILFSLVFQAEIFELQCGYVCVCVFYILVRAIILCATRATAALGVAVSPSGRIYDGLFQRRLLVCRMLFYLQKKMRKLMRIAQTMTLICWPELFHASGAWKVFSRI